MKTIMIWNDQPCGSERAKNGFRLANNLLRMVQDIELTVFLMGDSTSCAKTDEQKPGGYYDLEGMIKPLLRKGKVLLCGTCMDARGLKEEQIVEGCERSTLDELTDLTAEAEKVIVF